MNEAPASDLLFLFELRGWLWDLLRGGRLKGGRRRLATRMRGYWVRFVASGSPGDDWPPYRLPERAVRLFGRRDRMVCDPDRARREAWGGRDVPTGSIDAGALGHN